MKSKIGIIGANARAVTDSAARAGYETYLIDYFSDLDTSKSADCVFSMQKNPLNPNFREEYSREKLTDFAIEKLNGRVNDVLLASSIGSDYRMIEKLENHFKILGNNSKQVKNARNWEFLMKIFNKFKIKNPKTLIFDSFDAVGFSFRFPFVIKPSVEKEFQMKLINNKQDLRNFLEETKEKFKINNKKLHGKILVQEFIRGIPISSSVLGNGKEAVTISINKQLIGMRELNSPGEFTYCGHVTPANLNKNLKFKISEISGKIISELGLVGSVGVDFVLRNNGNSFEIYFIEINPRFQDTLETVEKYRNMNLVEKHLKALDGKLDNNHQNHQEKYFAKGILFADKRTKAGNLNNISSIHDIPREGTLILEAEPVCTISSIGKDEVGAVKNLYSKIKSIKKELY